MLTTSMCIPTSYTTSTILAIMLAIIFEWFVPSPANLKVSNHPGKLRKVLYWVLFSIATIVWTVMMQAQPILCWVLCTPPIEKGQCGSLERAPSSHPSPSPKPYGPSGPYADVYESILFHRQLIMAFSGILLPFLLTVLQRWFVISGLPESQNTR